MDIKIEPEKLNEVINVLKQDNQNIYNVINNIYSAVNKLDEGVWKSPGKRKVVEELIPYLEEKKEIEFVNLNNNTDVLTKALNDYVTTNNIILKGTESLIGSEIVGG